MKVDTVTLNDLLTKLTNIDNTPYLNPLDKDGDIGERFVKDNIKYYMSKKGFKLRPSGNRTYYIEKPPKKGKVGADFPFCFTHNNSLYNCYIESKNWKVYQFIPQKMFQNEILDRFILKANQHGSIWILTINQANIHLISQRCQQHNIFIVPIDTKITTAQLTLANLRPIMEHFIDEFHKLITSLIQINIHKPKKQVRANSRPYDDDIILGLPSDLIARMHGTTKQNIEKRRSELNSQGVNVLDMRSKTAYLARFITKNQLDTSYLMGIIIRMLKEKYRD
jgi:hypothetical protein